MKIINNNNQKKNVLYERETAQTHIKTLPKIFDIFVYKINQQNPPTRIHIILGLYSHVAIKL